MSTCPNDDNSEGWLEPPVVLSSIDGFRKALIRSCPACGCADRIPRIWCSRCGAPLAMDRDALRAEESSEEALEGHAKFYRAVLADQDRLLSQQYVSQTQIQPIRLFYNQRLQDVLGELSNLRNQRELNKLIEQVVSVAQSGQVEQARQRLTLELKRWPEEALLKELYDEIDGRYRQIQADLQAKKQAQELFASANAFIQKQDYEAASNALQSARELQPDDVAIEVCLQQTEELLRQQAEEVLCQQAEEVLCQERENEQLPNEQASPFGVVGTTEDEALITASIVSPSSIITDNPLAASSTTTHIGGAKPTPSPSMKGEPAVPEPEVPEPAVQLRAVPSFADEEEAPNVAQRHLEALSSWTNLVKPFLMDNVGWFVGAFLVIAGFVVLIVTFWNTIEQNQILMHSLVFAALFLATSLFFAAAYFMRLKYPQLESSSDVLLVIVALLIPLVFAAAILTALIPATQTGDSLVQVGQAVDL